MKSKLIHRLCLLVSLSCILCISANAQQVKNVPLSAPRLLTVKVRDDAPAIAKQLFSGRKTSNNTITTIKTSSDGTSLAVMFTNDTLSSVMILDVSGNVITSTNVSRRRNTTGDAAVQKCADAYCSCMAKCGKSVSGCDVGCTYDYIVCIGSTAVNGAVLQ